jgi:hypothetical protein
VLGVDATTPFEEIARRHHELATKLHPDTHPDDPAAAAWLATINGAWARIKYEVRRRRHRLAAADHATAGGLTPCVWPRPPAVRSAAFEGCELRPTDTARCFRVMRRGIHLCTLYRHPDDARVLFARNDQGRVVRVNGAQLWVVDADGEIRPMA